MMVIITGVNRVEICVPTRKQEGLHFFKTRNQLYRAFPDALTRIRIFDYDMEIGSEEGIIYRENDTVPYSTCDMDYSMDRLLSDVDRHKLMREGGITKPKNVWFTNTAKGLWSSIYKMVGWPGIVIGAVLIYAFLAPKLGM